MASPSTWRLLLTPPDSGAWNMALDVALARCLRPDEGVLRLYGWRHPTLSLGRNQPAKQRYGSVAPTLLGRHIVRRPTGGSEVLHDRELTYSVVLPSRALGGPRATYRRLNSALLDAIRRLRIPARLATPHGPCPRPGAGACFGAAVNDEIEVSGRKLVGSAQARIGNALLQHGSIPLEPPSSGPGALRSVGVSLSELAGKPVDLAAVRRAVETAMRRALGGRWSNRELRANERRVAASLLRHYESPTWTWRT